jgi:hypothetical protein
MNQRGGAHHQPLCLGLGLLALACLVLFAFLSPPLVLELLVLETLVWPRGEYIGVTY